MVYFFGIVLIYIIYQIIELNRFSVKRINLSHESATGNFVFLSDVHGKTYGNPAKKKSRLINKINELNPEAIILGGDTVSKGHPEQYETMLEFLSQLVEIAPVYYLFGNHETALEVRDEKRFKEYCDALLKIGVKIIRNDGFFPCKDEKIFGYSLELPLTQYEKGTKKVLPKTVLNDAKSRIGNYINNDAKELKLLFVHQPSYAEDYLMLKPDAIFSGHSHGGLVRIPGIGGLVSTELTLFPKYDGGTYYIGENKKTTLVVSQGLGTHHFHIRVLDPAQLIYVEISSCKEAKN